jgi:hypothetical protein
MELKPDSFSQGKKCNIKTFGEIYKLKVQTNLVYFTVSFVLVWLNIKQIQNTESPLEQLLIHLLPFYVRTTYLEHLLFRNIKYRTNKKYIVL